MKTSEKKIQAGSRYNIKLMFLWVGVFAAIGVATLLLTKAATPGIAMTVDTTLPNPTNVKSFADDRVATIAWTPVADPASKNIIGYYVTWGSGSTYTNARQTEYNSIQIQPLINGTLYNVKVQAVEGSEVTVATPGAHESEFAKERRANGKVSTGVSTTVTASSARVDQLRTQMTGFFDDFNTAAGAFNELKWNTASSTCVPPGETGAFINNQFHAHSEARSSYGNFTYCDRGQSINRPRGIFDTTGRNEANPGVLTFDFDGVTHGRDKWYIDLIPTSARKTGAPLDLTSHASIEDNDVSDPTMLRISQTAGGLKFDAFGDDKQPEKVNLTFINCPDFANNMSFNPGWCGGNYGSAVAGLSPLPELPVNNDNPGTIPNVRRHWRLEISPTKIKMYLDSTLMLVGDMPANLSGVRQWYVHNNIFTYNTGKLDDTNPTTAILHWDNFGWNGPAQNTVVHNYLDGGVDGTTPYIARGTLADQTGSGNRSLKINMPDPVASPVKARLMFTFGAYGFQSYSWRNGDNIVVNGKTYTYSDPATSSMLPPMATDHLADTSMNYSDSITLNPADLKQGMNDVQLNLTHDSGMNLVNVHLELEYTKGTEPAYTQPSAIFSTAKLLSSIQPTIASHDSYLFIEQDFGLPSGSIDSGTPVNPPPTSGDTTKPTIVLNEPINNTIVSGNSFTATATASDNVGVTKVEFYLGNTLKFTGSSSPFTTTISTSGLSPASYAVVAVAYDAAGNTTNSTASTIVIPQPTDTTKPSVAIVSPVANAQLKGASASIQATADDASGIAKVEFYVDGSMISTDTSAPYSAALDTTKLTNATHSLMARAYDTLGNTQDSTAVSISVSNTVADTTNPTVSISAPLAAATISGNLAFVQAAASDAGGIAKVEFFINGNLLGTDTAAPYSFTIDTAQYANGTYNLTAKAYDNSNNTSTSDAVIVKIVNLDTTPPSVIITAPFNNTIINGNYTVSANASDVFGVVKVDFSVDGGNTVSSSPQPPYSYTLDTTKLTNAAHSIKATAFDAANNNSSATVNVTINNTAPTVKKCDFNNDSVVDTNDLFILLANFNKTVSSGTKGDCSGNGKVDIDDLFLLLGLYGR